MSIKIGFIGAGHVNFGIFKGERAERPWNHCKRLQQIDGLEFTAVVDINVDLADSRIQDMKEGAFASKWEKAKAFKTCEEMLASPEKPDAVYIGVPPTCHGAISNPEAALELKLAKAGVHLFVEKPLSIQSVEEVTRLGEELASIQKADDLVIAVGYMLRYSSSIQVAQQILKDYNAKPIVIHARYSCAYEHIKKRAFWDSSLSGGPIVEQATHFVDLLRLFGGQVVPESIKANAVGPSQPLSSMQEPPNAEHEVPLERRINRATMATFQFSSGAIGSLTHSLILQGSQYHTAIEIMGDGLHIIIEDPYNANTVLVRRPHSSEYEQVSVPETDMFMTQAETFIKAIRTGDSSAIRSPYQDALESYKLSKQIAVASS